MFFLLYKYNDDAVFDDFPKISDHFPKISEDFPKLSRRPDERSRTFSDNFRKFPKMPEDCRILPKTFEEDPKMFRWYTNEFKYNLRDKLNITEVIDIFTCEDIISSHVRISYRFYQFVTTRYTTDFYIIILDSLDNVQMTLYPDASTKQIRRWYITGEFEVKNKSWGAHYLKHWYICQYGEMSKIRPKPARTF